MGVLFAFVVGWLLGARGGQQSYDEVVESAKVVLRSDEFALFKTAIRRHAGATLQQAAEWLQSDREGGAGNLEDVIARVRQLVRPPANAS